MVCAIGTTLLTSVAYTSVAAATSLTWTATGALDGCAPKSPSCMGRSDHSATLLKNGSILVAGGATTKGPTGTTEVFDPVTGRWSATGSMSEPRAHHTATLLPDGRVLAVGGSRDSTSTEVYDPDKGTWSATGSLSAPRYFHTATLLTGAAATCGTRCGKVLVAGGYALSATAELYDPVSGVWSPAGRLSENRQSPVAVQLPSGKVLVAGGNDFGRPYGVRRSAELFDPLTGTWAPTGSIPARSGEQASPGAFSPTQYYPSDAGAVVLTGGTVLVAGGTFRCGGGRRCEQAALYDPVAAAWTLTGSLHHGRSELTALLLPDGEVLAAGSSPDSGASTELYDPATGGWTEGAPLGHPRLGHTTTLIPDGAAAQCGRNCGRILVAGGADPADATIPATAELSSSVTAGGTAPPGTNLAANSGGDGVPSHARAVLLVVGAAMVAALAMLVLWLRRRVRS